MNFFEKDKLIEEKTESYMNDDTVKIIFTKDKICFRLVRKFKISNCPKPMILTKMLELFLNKKFYSILKLPSSFNKFQMMINLCDHWGIIGIIGYHVNKYFIRERKFNDISHFNQTSKN